MSFDRTDPADWLALKAEVATDPIGMGYDLAGPTQQIIKLLNDPDLNVGGDTASRPFDASAMLDALDPTEFESPQTGAGAPNYVHTLVEMATIGSIEGYKAKFRGMFAANSATVVALDAQNVALSRAEVLFGQGTNISRDDWFAARDS